MLYAADYGLQIAKASTISNGQGRLDRNTYVNLYPRNNRFFGRNDVLQAISERLCPTTEDKARLRSFALYGITGIGKSQIATEFVYQNMRNFKAIFWISASNTEKLFQGFTDIAKELNISSGTAVNDQRVIVQIVNEWLRSTGKF